MYFLLSGEGPTDMGIGNPAMDICDDGDFQPGPMAAIIDQIVEEKHRYSPLESCCCGLVSEHALIKMEEELKLKNEFPIPGKRQEKETQYFFNNARVLAKIAQRKAKQLGDEVVAVLFRDTDKPSRGRGKWAAKLQSAHDGFRQDGFSKGVPMIPKPSSEAWLLCALKPAPYQNCADLENRSARPKSSNSLKKELEERLGEEPSREILFDKVKNKTIDHSKINMPSFEAFKTRLEKAL
jgi:hypothetical protein